MLRSLSDLLRQTWGEGGKLLMFASFLLLAWGTFAPISTLIWWLDGGAEKLETEIQQLRQRLANPSAEQEGPTCYVAFLTGVGDFSANELADGEDAFLDQLAQDHPGCVFVRNVFPYSASNQDVGGQEVFEFLWRLSQQIDEGFDPGKILLRIRNTWRFAISADDRYGSVYNRGIALAILEQMDNQQPIAVSEDEPIQLILIGTSGGAQVALGAAPYLQQTLPVEITVVSFGGVFSGTKGFNAADQVYHFRGKEDWVENLGGILFSSRWLWTWGSPYHRARRQGRYRAYLSGPHEHDGPQGYFGLAPVDDDTTYVDLSVQQINQLPIWPTRE